jgi:serine/threonine protein kinase
MSRLPVPSRFEQFELLQFLALGLSGEVYKARHKDGSLVALKIFDKERDKTVFGYFTNEQLLLREVTQHRQHPYIVEYVASNLVLPPYYLATRYIDGARSLATLLGAPLNPGFVLSVVEQIASALDYLHYEHPTYSPIVHRDVKPDNILIDAGNNAILIDLSIATHPGYALEDARGLGTPRYMAPEQYLGEEIPATDQFALAAVALHMLVGQPLLPSNPKKARNKLDDLRDSQFAEVHKQLGSRTHTANVITRALQFDPQQRYGSCMELAEQLCQALLADGLVLLDESPPAQRAGGYLGYLAMAGAGLLAVVVLFLALTGLSSPPPEPPAPTPTVFIEVGAPTLKPTATLTSFTATPMITPSNTPTVCSKSVWVVSDKGEPLRAGPSTKELVLDTMPRGAALTLITCETQQADAFSWYQVSYNDQSGWSRVSSVQSAPPPPPPTSKPRPRSTTPPTSEPATAAPTPEPPTPEQSTAPLTPDLPTAPSDLPTAPSEQPLAPPSEPTSAPPSEPTSAPSEPTSESASEPSEPTSEPTSGYPPP